MPHTKKPRSAQHFAFRSPPPPRLSPDLGPFFMLHSFRQLRFNFQIFKGLLCQLTKGSNTRRQRASERANDTNRPRRRSWKPHTLLWLDWISVRSWWSLIPGFPASNPPLRLSSSSSPSVIGRPLRAGGKRLLPIVLSSHLDRTGSSPVIPVRRISFVELIRLSARSTRLTVMWCAVSPFQLGAFKGLNGGHNRRNSIDPGREV